MMPRVLEERSLKATLIFDAEDRFARDQGLHGPHPRPFGKVRFFAAGRMVNGAEVKFPKPLELQIMPNPSGYYLFFGQVVSGDTTYQSGFLPPDTYVIVVNSDYYQPFKMQVALPESNLPTRFALEPNVTYPFPAKTTLLRGTLLRNLGAGRRAGIEGAMVDVTNVSNQCRTDANGSWVLTFPRNQPSGNVTAHFVLPDHSVRNVPGIAIVREQATNHVLVT